jgi:hypothetical protein
VAIGVVAAVVGGTTLQKKKTPLPEVLLRELLRARYRFAVGLRNVLKSRPNLGGRES